MPISGWSSTLAKDVLLDTGVLFVGATAIGVSRGGLSFDPAKELRNIEFDGKKSPLLGLDRVVKVAPVISGTMIELGQADVGGFYEPGSTSTFASATAVTGVITPKKSGILLVAGDYLTNLALVCERADGSGFVRWRFPKAFCRKYSVKGTDGEEFEAAVEFAAVLDLGASGATIGDVPYVFEGVATATGA